MNNVNRRWLLGGAAAAGFVAAAPTWARGEQPLNADERARLGKLANEYLRTYNLPGLSVAIARHGRLVYADGFGVADTSTGEPVTDAHLFRIASVSKPITSVGIFLLIEQGKLSLTDKVFGPTGILGSDFEIAAGRPATDITVGHLLTHLSGGWGNNPADPMDAYKTMDHRELIAWTLKSQQLAARPGSRFAYSNFGYCLLGRIIEKRSGQSYADHVRRAVLGPCGVTAMTIAESSRTRRADKEVVYYHPSWDPYAINMPRNDSTGGWIASATDVVRFAVHVSGFDQPPNILRPQTIQTMVTPTKLNPRYAHGWSVLKGNWRHDGALPGSMATLVRTQSGYCWAALVNSSRPNGNHALDNLMWNMVRSIEHWSPGDSPRRS